MIRVWVLPRWHRILGLVVVVVLVVVFSGPARVLHTHVHRVRRLRRRRWGESWVWVLHTDDGRVAVSAALPEIHVLLDVLRRAGADVPG